MNTPKKKILNYFDYDQIVSFSFGSIEIVYGFFDLRMNEFSYNGSELIACLFKYDLFESYDDYEFISFGLLTRCKTNFSEGNRTLYIDRLVDKVEHLFTIEPNIEKPLKQAKDRLYQRAVVQYFKSLMEKIVGNDNISLSKNRYLMTYPSHWTLEQAAYLRSLLQMAGIVDEDDHPDRLIMYNEGETILRYIQVPLSNFPNVREGQKYMICDLSGTKVEMNLYDINGPIHPKSDIKCASHCNWYNGSIEEPAQMYIRKRDFYPETMLFLSSLLSTSSIKITVKDLEDALNFGGGVFKYWHYLDKMEGLTNYDVETNDSNSYCFSQSLHDLYHEKLNNMKESMTEQLPRWIKDQCIELYPREIIENLLTPVFDRITQYIKIITATITDTIEDVIFVSNKYDTYLMKLIADGCKETTKTKMYKICKNDIKYGAVLKCLDSITTFDIYKPKIVHDDLDLSPKPEVTNTQDVIILIDYGLEKIRVSYIHVQPGQTVGDANIKHIVNWPGQSTPNRDFPTLNAMLVPKYPVNIGKDSKSDLWWEYDLFGTSLSQNSSKAMLILQDNNQGISTLANTIFYTFEKDEYGIILVTHQKKEKRNVVEKFLIVTPTANLISSAYEVTRKRISFQEFSLLYFNYLADFLRTYIYSKTGVEKNKYRYCITYDNQDYPEKFTLSNKNIRQIALESNLISTDIPSSLLVIEHAKAAAIYCRKLIGTAMANDQETYLHFLQVQMHTDRCLLILNTVPLLDPEDSNNYRENGKPWESVYKYAKTKNASINFLEIISENLWIYMQRIGASLLRKCKQHQSQKKFFNSKNMQSIKNMFYDYISTTKDLDLEDGEKEHKIRICDEDPGSCCYLVTTNMDLLEFAFNSAINQFVSIIQSSVINENLFEGIKISDIFIMGEFLNCQDYVSYRFLEEILLAKLRSIYFPRFDNVILQNMTKKTQVRKLNGREYQQEQDGSTEYRYDSLAQVASIGSYMFVINPRNLLVERLAAKTYVIQLDNSSTSNVVYNHMGRTSDGGSSYHIIVSKGTPLNSLTLVEDTISKYFMITENDVEEKEEEEEEEEEDFCHIYLLAVDDDDVSYLTDTNMDENTWRDKFRDSNFENLKRFSIFHDGGFHNDFSYPISFKFRVSQTERYELWVEQGKHSERTIETILEPILLKSCYNE